MACIIVLKSLLHASEILHDPEKSQAYILKIRNGTKHKREMDVHHYAVQEFMNLHSKKVPKYTIEAILKRYNEVFQLDQRETMVVRCLTAQREMSNAGYRRMAGVSKPTATRHLAILVQKGLISGSSCGAGAADTLVPLATKNRLIQGSK